jgi:malonyl-CoA/methylmalonyl-CoA synthetase
VYPKEIELVLEDVTGVRESAVIGVPHPDFGEAVVAVLAVEPRPQDDDLDTRMDTALSARLARFKHPKSRVIVDELPRNAMGKIQKNVLRERYASLFTDA